MRRLRVRDWLRDLQSVLKKRRYNMAAGEKATGKEQCQERVLHRDQIFIPLDFLIGINKKC